MNIQRIVEAYESGMITENECMINLISLMNDANVGQILAEIPSDIRRECVVKALTVPDGVMLFQMGVSQKDLEIAEKKYREGIKSIKILVDSIRRI